MNNTLLPCPFCGKQIAEIGNCKNMEECEHFEECPAVEPYVCVVCSINKGGCGASTGYQEGVEKAIAAWNRRAGKDINVATNSAVPVVRGEWIAKPHIISLNNMTLTGTYPTCNLCDYAWLGVAKNTNYCPNCGARMEDKPCG